MALWFPLAAPHATVATMPNRSTVVEGSGTLVTGGTLREEKRTNAENLTGSGIQGGTSRRLAKGDWVMVPEKTPHWFTQVNGALVLMSLHMPHGQ